MFEKIFKALLRLFIGFFICSLGFIFMMNANLGLAPWDVLHQGISKNIGITIGTASIVLGFIVVILDAILGENIGIGTVLNMIFIGVFMDLIIFSNLVPIANNIIQGIVMLIIGMSLAGFGTVLYMGCGLGSGPRDGLMVAIQKRTNKPIKLIRGTIEIAALVVGYFLGGKVGLGTIIISLGLGYIIQITFKVCKFDSKSIQHRFIVDDIKNIKKYFDNTDNEPIENFTDSN